MNSGFRKAFELAHLVRLLLPLCRIRVSLVLLIFESVAPPSGEGLLQPPGPGAKAQTLQRLGDEALRGGDAQHHQQLGLTACWTRRTRTTSLFWCFMYTLQPEATLYSRVKVVGSPMAS